MAETIDEKIARSNILVVDDTQENLQLLLHALNHEGFRVRPARSGLLALEGARRIPPDLVMLDINMPVMDGYQVCAAFKSDPALAAIPIIFISALDETFDKVKAFDAGGVDYITKPFQIEEVVARVRTHLALRWHQVERDEMVANLQTALDEVKTLRGFIPICANCKSVRDDKGFWNSIEGYMREHTLAEFSHGVCPSCAKVLYPECTDFS